VTVPPFLSLFSSFLLGYGLAFAVSLFVCAARAWAARVEFWIFVQLQQFLSQKFVQFAY
jgi:hypothetical protein